MSEINKDNYLHKLFIDDVKGMLGGGDGGNSGGGGSSGGGIVTVDALPTEGNEDTIYRLAIEEMKMIEFSEDGTPYASEEITVEVVNALPTVGNPCMNMETEKAYVYYSKTDGAAMAYVTEELAAESGVTAGWHSWIEIMGGTEQTKTVIVSSLSEVGEQGSLYILSISNANLYHYYNGKYIKLVDEEDKGSASGGGIIDVDTLPTENIDASAIYRVKEGNPTLEMPSACVSIPLTVVDELPETGDSETPYFLTTDQKLYQYLTAEGATEMSSTEGWHEYATLTGMEYVVVASVDEIPEGGMGCVISFQNNLYCYSPEDATYIKIITSKNFEFDETTGTLVLNL